MSSSNDASSQKQQQQAASPSGKASGVASPPAFNYAAAAKSKQQVNNAALTSPSSASSATNGNGKPASNTTPSASSNLNPASTGLPNGNDGSNTRRQTAVSMPKSAAGGAMQGKAGINFGSVHDSTAGLSSSPAVLPTSGQHLQGDKPALFGSVEAAKEPSNESKQKVVGFAGKESTARPPMDFNKLFQGGGGNKPAAPKQLEATAATAQDGATPPATSTGSSSTPASVAVEAPSPARNAPPGATSNAPSPGMVNATPMTPQHAGARPVESQHSPSPYNHQPLRAPASGGFPHFHPQQQHGGVSQYQQQHQQHQQHRASHMGGYTPGMQQMMGAVQGQWPPQMYYPQMTTHGYPQYNGGPGPHWNQQQQQQQQQPDMSPRVQASPMAPHPSSASLASSTPASASSPAASRAHTGPYSPSTVPSSVGSPQPHANHVAMGYPQNARAPPFVHNPTSSYGGHVHTPSGSFSAGPGAHPMMSPAARQFEPTKRASSAIRIVNPETKTAIDIKAPAPTAPKVDATTPSASPALSSAVSASAPAPVAPAAPATPKTRPSVTLGRSDSSSGQAPQSEAKKIETVQGFLARVKALAEENNKAKVEAAAAKEREALDEETRDKDALAEEERRKTAEADAEAARKREEEASARKAAEAEAAARQEAEDKERATKAEAEKKEEEAREAAQAEDKAAREKEVAKAAAAEERKITEETERKHAAATAEEAQAASSSGGDKEPPAEEVKISARENASGEETGKDSLAALATARSVADIERMAREVSSVPSTPLEASGSRSSMFASVAPRTPGTPGFANLPAKPMAPMSNANANGSNIVLDSAQLEKRKRPQQLDTAAAQRTASTTSEAPTSGEPPISAASATLGSARPIEDLSKVTYPGKVQSPRKELNETAAPGKFRYDRDFLLQFMNVWSEKPQDMPALASIGMEQGQPGVGRASTSGRRASGLGAATAGSGRGAAGLGLGLGAAGGSAFGRPVAGGAMGTFSHPAKTSEERFAQSNAGLRGAPASAFASSGPMGSFNAGSRTQPMSRGGSGSASALPSREMMGTGAPAGSRTQSRRGRTREPGQTRGERVNPPERGGPTIPMDQVAPLANSDSRWQVGTGSKLTSDSPELIQRKVKALLNKLTIEKFVSISDQILDWANKSVDETDGRTLRQVIALIFEKATDEAAWSAMYAQLCRKLMEKLSPEVTDDNLKSSDGKLVVGGALFRKYLLNRCQEDFERGWAHRDAMIDAAKSKEAEDKAKKDINEKSEAAAKEAAERGEKTEEKEAELMSEEYYIAQKAKRRGLGLVRFIGELYKLQMLTEKIMHLCIVKLLSNLADPEEEEIESLCKLLTTIGRQLDNEKARSHLDVYFQRMNEMTQSEKVNSRMKFMLLDVIEMRANGWKAKKGEAAGPKSIAQIHEDAAKQKQQAEIDLANRSRGVGPPSRGGSRRGGQRGDMPGGQIGPDGWQTMGGAPPPRPARAGDLASFGKIERGGSGRPLSLGPGPNSVFAKKQQKSSEDGSKPPSRTASSANMFEMLQQAESSEQAASGAGGSASGGAAERPKLNLAPRTKPIPTEGIEGAEGEEVPGVEAGEEDEEDEEDAIAEVSDADAPRKIGEDVKEFLEIRNVDEGVLAMRSLPPSHRSAFVGKLVSTALDRKVDLVRVVGQLLAKIRSSELMDDGSFEEGFTLAGIADLDDMSIDVPQVYNLIAILLVDSGLSQASLEKLAETIVGEGIKTPKAKLMEKVTAERESRA